MQSVIVWKMLSRWTQPTQLSLTKSFLNSCKWLFLEGILLLWWPEFWILRWLFFFFFLNWGCSSMWRANPTSDLYIASFVVIKENGPRQRVEIWNSQSRGCLWIYGYTIFKMQFIASSIYFCFAKHKVSSCIRSFPGIISYIIK